MRRAVALLGLAVFWELSARAEIQNPRVTTDRAPDTSSRAAIVKSVLKPGMTNDEKAIAIYDFLRLAMWHRQYPTEKGGVGPLKAINVYGWWLCGGLHTAMGELYKEAGFPYRYRGWSDPGHTTVEVEYDGKWHYLDHFLCFYAWTRDRKTIAGQDDIIRDPEIALQAEADKRGPVNILSCGDTKEVVVSGCKSSKVMGGWGGSMTQSDGDYTLDYALGPGQSLKLLWGVVEGVKPVGADTPQHGCGLKDFRSHPLQGPLQEHYGLRTFAHGELVWEPDFNKGDFLAALTHKDNLKLAGGALLPAQGGKPAVAVFKMASPYIVAQASAEAQFVDGEGKLSWSADNQNWKPVEDLAAGARGLYAYYLKLEMARGCKSLRMASIVQQNKYALPFLVNGENKLTVTVKNPEALKKEHLIVTLAYQEATAPAKRERYDGKGITYGEEKVVSKEVDRSPFEFTIQVGGNTPPRMKYLKKEVKGR